MPFFIVFGLSLCYLIQVQAPILNVLASPLFTYLSAGLALIVIVGVLFKKISQKFAYDVFAASVLLVWYGYWQPFFGEESPIFFIFPLYLVFMTAFVMLFFINQRHRIDVQSLSIMRRVEKEAILQPWLIMLGTLGSLQLIDHYLLFPIMMTLVILRFALFACLLP